MNYLDWIAKWSSYTPHKTAVVCCDTKRSFSYAGLDEEALKIGSYLQNKFQLNKGDRIAVLAEHSPEYLMLFIATQRLGIILVPLNYRSSSYELLYYINDVTPSLIIAEDKKFKSLSPGLKEQEQAPLVSFEDFFEAARLLRVTRPGPQFEIETEQPIFIFYTSGTTGKPKGVIYTNRMMFWNSLNTAVQLEITSGDHTVNALPPYHTSGWNVLLLPMLHRGARVDFIKKFKPKKLLQYLEKEPVSLFFAVPTMLRMMLDAPAFETFKANRIKYFIVGGEPLSTAVINSWAAKNILIRQGYGLTEAGPGITSLHHHDALWKKGSIGKPNFYVDVKILNKNNEVVEVNEAGELCLRGHIVTPGYWNNSAYTLEKIKNGWLYTGDMVRRDHEGFLYFLGRKDQIYISGGENIHPSEIEKILYKLEGVQEAAVIGVEDIKWGEIGVAFLVLQRELREKEIFEYLKQFLASYKIPRKVIFLESLPKSGIGKINRKQLKDAYKIMTHDKKGFL